MYPRVHSHFVLRPIIGKAAYLIDPRTGSYWELDDDEVSVVSAFDGTKSISDLRKNFPEVENLSEYVHELINEGIIEALHSPEFLKVDIRPSTNPPHLNDVLIEITGKCNLKCKHCFNDKFNKAIELDAEFETSEILELIDQLDRMNVRRVQISGGEALMHKDLFVLLDSIKNKKIFLDVISTNATLITNDVAEKLSPYFKFGGALYVSLDGVKEHSHEKLRGKGTFKNTINGIKNLERNGCKVLINTMIHAFNIDELDDMYTFLKTFKNISGWRLGIPKQLGRFSGNHDQFDVKATDAINSIIGIFKRRFKDNDNFRIEAGDVFRTDVLDVGWFAHSIDDHPCKYALENCTIKPNGNVAFCASLDSTGYKPSIIGNIRTDGMQKVWHSPSHEYVKSLKISNLEDCHGCRYLSICGGGCRANAKLTTGEYLGRDQYSCIGMEMLEHDLLPYLSSGLVAGFNKLINEAGWVPSSV